MVFDSKRRLAGSAGTSVLRIRVLAVANIRLDYWNFLYFVQNLSIFMIKTNFRASFLFFPPKQARWDILFFIFFPPTRAKRPLSELVNQTIYWVSPKMTKNVCAFYILFFPFSQLMRVLTWSYFAPVVDVDSRLPGPTPATSVSGGCSEKTSAKISPKSPCPSRSMNQSTCSK